MCVVQPMSVADNVSFIIDVDVVNFHDLKADDLGSWSTTGTKKSYFYFSSSGVLKVNTKRGSSSVSNYFTLTRRYYVHKSYNRFHRQLVDIKGIFIE